MNGSIDLHVHSNYSDGLYSPARLVRMARERGLSSMAITDHDTIRGLPEAVRFGKKEKVEIIPGVELSSNYRGRELHILGYYYYISGKLEEIFRRLKSERYQRARKMIGKLEKINLPVCWEEVLKEAGEAAPGRLHLARLMVKKKYVRNINEAFHKYLEKGRPAYFPRIKLKVEEAVSCLNQAGAVTVLAHPGVTGEGLRTVSYLKSFGLQGIEVYHPRHSLLDRLKYRYLAQKEKLLVTGGTDYHGDESGNSAFYPGCISLPPKELSRLKISKAQRGKQNSTRRRVLW